MRCDELRALIDLYLDEELDAADRAEIDAHGATCEACGRLLSQQTAFKQGLRALSCEHRLDDAFQARLTSVIARADCPASSPRGGSRRFAAVAVALVGLSAGAFATFGHRAAVDGTEVRSATGFAAVAPEVVDESVRWHSRPLPVEITGPDEETVANWFRGKVDFPVSPPAFSQRAYLLGGRLGNVRQNEAAYLVYDVDGSKLSVMVFDAHDHDSEAGAAADSGPEPYYVGERNGYNVAVHRRDGVAYTFTSDLPDREFVDLVNVAFSY